MHMVSEVVWWPVSQDTILGYTWSAHAREKIWREPIWQEPIWREPIWWEPDLSRPALQVYVAWTECPVLESYTCRDHRSVQHNITGIQRSILRSLSEINIWDWYLYWSLYPEIDLRDRSLRYLRAIQKLILILISEIYLSIYWYRGWSRIFIYGIDLGIYILDQSLGWSVRSISNIDLWDRSMRSLNRHLESIMRSIMGSIYEINIWNWVVYQSLYLEINFWDLYSCLINLWDLWD